MSEHGTSLTKSVLELCVVSVDFTFTTASTKKLSTVLTRLSQLIVCTKTNGSLVGVPTCDLSNLIKPFLLSEMWSPSMNSRLKLGATLQIVMEFNKSLHRLWLALNKLSNLTGGRGKFGTIASNSA